MTLDEMLKVIDGDRDRAVERLGHIEGDDKRPIQVIVLREKIAALNYLRDKLVGMSEGRTFRSVPIGHQFGWVHGVTIYRKTAPDRAQLLSDGGEKWSPEQTIADLDSPIR